MAIENVVKSKNDRPSNKQILIGGIVIFVGISGMAMARVVEYWQDKIDYPIIQHIGAVISGKGYENYKKEGEERVKQYFIKKFDRCDYNGNGEINLEEYIKCNGLEK